eukprot:c5721_g1_i1 orf=143-295(+)
MRTPSFQILFTCKCAMLRAFGHVSGLAVLRKNMTLLSVSYFMINTIESLG